MRRWAGQFLFIILLAVFILVGCAPPGSAPMVMFAAARSVPVVEDESQGSTQAPQAVQKKLPIIAETHTRPILTQPAQKEPARAAVLSPQIKSPLPTQAIILPGVDRWKEWPVLPVVPVEMRRVYQEGLARGNNPHAFSILGDCQSQPEVFMGIYDSDPAALRALPAGLRETAAHFAGSFDRYSPTVKDGTTEGALLWGQWNDNKEKKCKPGETPLDCELRVHRSSIVFVHVGTHWEARSQRYFSIIIEKILASGAVPVLVTKADNRELDERVNQNYASLAVQYGVPMWNFWASVQHLPGGGMQPGSDMYLSEEGLKVHQRGALEALNAVWRGLR